MGHGSNGSLFLVGQVGHGSGAKNMMGQDGSKFTGQSISILQEVQEHGVQAYWILFNGVKNRKILPKLSKMALTIFLIQGSSANSERHYIVLSTHVILSHH